jgi:hypothetical protein
MAAYSEKLALENTGAQSLATGLNSSTQDFGNDLIALLESSGAGTRAGDTFTIHLGFPIHADSDKKNLDLGAAFKDPKLDPAVANLLTGNDLDNAKSATSQRDRDVTFRVAWSLQPRSLTPLLKAAARHDHRDAPASVADTLSGIVSGAVDFDARAYWTAREADLKAAADLKEADLKAPELTVTETNHDAVDLMVLAAVENARSLHRLWVEQRVDKVARVAAEAAMDQSQFWGAAQYHYTDALIGAREAKVNLTYELAMSSEAAATFSRYLVARPDFNSLDDVSDSDSTPAAKPRFSFTGAYDQVQRRTFALPALASLIKPSSHTVSLAIVAGWKIATLSNNRNARLDLNGTFENDSSNAAKKNRVIGSLTFTQKLSDKITLPLALVYASHANDLDVTRRFSAHFGISYKLPPADAAAAKASLLAAMP